MGRIVNQRELAEILDVSAKSVSLWQREGLPIALETDNGVENQYDTGAVIRWYVAREVTKGANETEKDRLNRLQGDKIELEIAEKRRELIPASEIEPAWVGMILAAREALLSIPDRIAPLLAHLDGVDAMRDLLSEQIEDALLKLAATDGERITDPAGSARAQPLVAASSDVTGGVG